MQPAPPAPVPHRHPSKVQYVCASARTPWRVPLPLKKQVCNGVTGCDIGSVAYKRWCHRRRRNVVDCATKFFFYDGSWCGQTLRVTLHSTGTLVRAITKPHCYAHAGDHAASAARFR